MIEGWESAGEIIGRLANEVKERAMAEGFCPNCGAARSGAFCASCGTNFSASQMTQLARGATTVQNLQLLLIVGLVLGFIGGAILGAYVLLPLGGLGIWAAIFAPFIGALVGSRVILEIVGR